MSIPLQVALFLASFAIVALAICVVPVAIQVGRSLKNLAVTTERLEASAQRLLQDSREMVRNVSELSDRTNRYVEEVGKVTHIVQQWTKEADQFVRLVGSIVEEPVLSLVCNTQVFGAGTSAFFRGLLSPHRQDKSRK